MAGTLQLLLQTACKRYSLLGNYTRLLMGSCRRSLHQPNLHRSKTLPTRPQRCPASTPRIGKVIGCKCQPISGGGYELLTSLRCQPCF